MRKVLTLFALFSLAYNVYAQSDSTKLSHYISIWYDTSGNENTVPKKEIRFNAPNGYTIKKIPFVTWDQFDAYKFSPNKKFLIHVKESRSDTSNKSTLQYSFISANGQTKWNKKTDIIKTHIAVDVGDELIRYYNFYFGNDDGSLALMKTMPNMDSSYLYLCDTLGTLRTTPLKIPTLSNINFTGYSNIACGELTPRYGSNDYFIILNLKTNETKQIMNNKPTGKLYYNFMQSDYNDANPPLKLLWFPNNAKGNLTKQEKIVRFSDIVSDPDSIFHD